MNDYQLIVIGAGSGGYTAALRAAGHGLKTAVIENREAGGTCLNRGCIPTKTLLHASEVFHSAGNGAGMGIHAEDIRIDIGELFAYKRSVSDKLRLGVENLLRGAGVPLIRGTARITAPHTVSVTDGDGTETVYTADNILAATGSVPALPPIPGLDLEGVMTSDELLEGADRLYRSIVIIGGGVIGVEFATFYSQLGCEVTVIEGLDRLLPNLDRELGQNLALILKKQGVRVFTGAMVQNVEQSEDGLTVNFISKGQPDSASGEVVLCAIGRRPYFDGLFAPELEPELNGKALRVDENYRTSIPGVYAIGDVSSRIQLAHVAAAQGAAVADTLTGVENGMDMNVVPSCIYCCPEIATVGITDAEAKASEIPVKTGKCVMGGNARTLITDPGRSFMKIVAHAETGEILGAHLMCMGSTDIISQISEAMANHMTASQLLKAMRPHPTFEEALAEALTDLIAKLSR